MAAIAKIDTIIGNLLNVEGQVADFVRGAVITGIDTTPGHEYTALFDAINATGMPAMGSVLSGSSLILSKIQLVPMSDRTARALLIYQTPRGFTPSAYLVTDGTFTSTRQTDLVPGSRTPIRIADYHDGSGGLIPGDNVTMNLFFPMRKIRVYKLQAGFSPSTSNANSVRKVNDSTWCELGKAYWILSQWVTSLSVYQGYYTIEAEAISRVVEDWSEFGILRNTTNGKKIAVDPGDIADANGMDYSYGIIYDTADTGLVRVGPYQTVDFAALFGFTTAIPSGYDIGDPFGFVSIT